MTGACRAHRIPLYATPEHECSYLPGQTAVTLFVDPGCEKGLDLYTALSDQGFRRSGGHLYRPSCPDCTACVPVRVPVDEFQLRRRHRRTWRRNADLEPAIVPAAFRDEHYALYRRYLAARHPGGGMDDPSPDQFTGFLTSPWAETAFVEFRLRGALLAVAVVDRLQDGLSAVYSFFDPAAARRSLGAYTVLWEIREARRRGLDWLYLGYWNEGTRKMCYKSDYLPQERLDDGRWVRVGAGGGCGPL